MTTLSHAPDRPDLCVFIGRFQPLHLGHLAVIREGLASAHRLLVLVGSANEPRTPRNPFTAAERMGWVQASVDRDPRLTVLPLEDSAYDLNDWLARVHRAVAATWAQVRAADPTAPAVPRVALIGYAKDASSYYLRLFPQWEAIAVPPHRLLDATAVREEIFGRADEQDGPAQRAAAAHLARERTVAGTPFATLPSPVTEALEAFLATQAYLDLRAERAHLAKHRRAWAGSPYPPTFVTADAVVVHEDRVLMLRRARCPGKGLWAVPGGFVEADETVEDAALRELAEETGLAMAPQDLRACIVARRVFDAPHRSARGRTITHAVRIDLPPGPPPPFKAVSAGDEEAMDLAWVPWAELRRDECFEDHHAMIAQLVGSASG